MHVDALPLYIIYHTKHHTTAHQWILWKSRHQQRWKSRPLMFGVASNKWSCFKLGSTACSSLISLLHQNAAVQTPSVLLTWCWRLLPQPLLTYIFKAQGYWCDASKSSFDTANGSFVCVSLENAPDTVPFTSRKSLTGLLPRSTLSAYPT